MSDDIEGAAKRTNKAKAREDRKAARQSRPVSGRAMLPTISIAVSSIGFFLNALGPLVVMLARDLGRDEADLAILGSAYGASLLFTGTLGAYLLRDSVVWVLRIAPFFGLAGLGTLVASNTFLLVLAGGISTAFASALMALAPPAALTGTRAGRDLSMANAAASSASILATIVFGLLDGTGVSGRFALLLLILPYIMTLRTAWTLPAVSFMGFLQGRSREVGVGTDVGTDVTPSSRGVPDDRQDQNARGSHEESHDEDTHRSQMEIPLMDHLRPKKVPIHTGYLLAGSMRVFLAVGSEFGFYVWGVARLVQTHASPALASILATGFALGMALGRVTGGLFVERKYAMQGYSLVALAGVALSVVANTHTLVALGFFLSGLGISCMYTLGIGGLRAVPGLHSNHAASLTIVMGGLGCLVAPVALSALGSVLPLQLAFGILIPIMVVLFFLPFPRVASHEFARP